MSLLDRAKEFAATRKREDDAKRTAKELQYEKLRKELDELKERIISGVRPLDGNGFVFELRSGGEVFALLRASGNKVAWFKARIETIEMAHPDNTYQEARVYARFYPPHPQNHDDTWDFEECREFHNGGSNGSCRIQDTADFFDWMAQKLAPWVKV